MTPLVGKITIFKIIFFVPYEKNYAFSAVYNLYFESELALKSNSKDFRPVHIHTDLGKKNPQSGDLWPLNTFD